MQIKYQGSDGCMRVLGNNELQHWKYIKKIGNRYFYTMDALQAYYRDQKMVANAEYKKDSYLYNREAQKRDKALNKEFNSNYKAVKNAKNVTVYNEDGTTRAETRAERQQQLKNMQKDHEKRQRMNSLLDRTMNTYLSAKRVVKPVANTAKRAVTPVDTPQTMIQKAKKNSGKSWLETHPLISHERETTIAVRPKGGGTAHITRTVDNGSSSKTYRTTTPSRNNSNTRKKKNQNNTRYSNTYAQRW